MKSQFSGYYRPTQAEFKELWEKCIFVIDTNVLINLYRYDEATRNDFLKTLEYVKDRLWIPHQVALEYQENRNQVIKTEEKRLSSIEAALSTVKSDIATKLNQFPSINPDDLLEKVDELFKKFLSEVHSTMSSQILCPEEDDYVREKLDSLFGDKIGDSPTNQQELEKIYTEGENRYKAKCPPGYKDEEKKKESPYFYNQMIFKREFGDFIIWKQILQQINKQGKQGWKHLVFITDDDKEDWWRIEKGQTVGPRPELVQEMHDSGVVIFYMYNSERFLKYANEYFEVGVKEESIKQVESITELEQNQKILPITSVLAKKNYPYIASLLFENLYGSNNAIKEEVAVTAVENWLKYQHSNDLIEQGKEIDAGPDLIRYQGETKNRFGYIIKYYNRGLRPSRILIENSIQQAKSFLKFSDIFDKIYVLLVTNGVTEGSLLRLSQAIAREIREKDEAGKIDFIIGSIFPLDAAILEQEIFHLEDSDKAFGKMIFVPQYSSDPEVPIFST